VTRPLRSARAGFTLLETLIALTVVGLVLGNIVMVTRSTSDAYDAEMSKASLELQLDQTLDRIALALMSASAASLQPGMANPAFHSTLSYAQSLGVQAGEVVHGAPERISLRIDAGEVVWIERPGEPGERMATWTRSVRDFLEGELPNGVDDNRNGLIDESGLTFVIESGVVRVLLTLEREGRGGESLTYTRESVVHCRNS
jgi:prepilin-type N-terminal cleavage/methylation domain-containing protein